MNDSQKREEQKKILEEISELIDVLPALKRRGFTDVTIKF